MALRSGYKGIKKLAAGLKWNRPGILAADDTALAKVFFPRSEQTVLGAKQLLPITLSKLKELNTGGTWVDNVYTFKGLIFTVAHDGDSVISITQKGTSTGTGYLYLGYLPLKNGDSFILNGSPSNTTAQTTYIRVGKGGTEGTFFKSNYGGNETAIDISEDNNYSFNIACGAVGITGTYVWKPMLRLASDPDPTYVPYAMTNIELTNSAINQKTAINTIISAATGAADFAAFKTAMGAITPVSRSLSREAVPEAEPAEVIEEKTVTKKSTKKTTVKEGDE